MAAATGPAVALLMKDPSEAKTRLAGLGADARADIARVLFRSGLTFWTRWPGAARVAVVTRSPEIAALAREAGAEVVPDPVGGGLDGAADAARRWAAGHGAQSLLVAHADLPVLDPAEVETICRAGADHAVVVAESTDGGSNLLLLTPPDAIRFAYGPGSAARHAQAAWLAGLPAVRLRLPGLALDIDTPRDLAAATTGLRIMPVTGLPEITPGCDLGTVLGDALVAQGLAPQPGDILVVAQKIVSKAEGRLAPLDAFPPSDRALRIGAEIGKDPRKVEAILSESTDLLRVRPGGESGVIIARHRQGWICANAGIDESNLGPGNEGMLLLLPEDADASARGLRAALESRFVRPLGVIVSDTFGRPWRNGLVNVAIGLAGLPAIDDWIGRTDADGRRLAVTQPALADEVTAAAGLMMPKDAGIPAVLVRGLAWTETPEARATDLLRPFNQEMFL